MWRPEGGRRRVGGPKRTWQDTLKEDLDTLGVDWNDARDTANERARDNSSPNVLLGTAGIKSK